MTWDEKCWGIFSNIYWTTRFIGMRGSKVTPELAQLLTEHNIALPKRGGQIYVREDSESELSKKLVGRPCLAGFRPNLTPRFLALAMPSICRSRLMSFSNSAIKAKIPMTSLPVREVHSLQSELGAGRPAFRRRLVT
jgi:hypothetical protein